jgi:hypothetical protein
MLWPSGAKRALKIGYSSWRSATRRQAGVGSKQPWIVGPLPSRRRLTTTSAGAHGRRRGHPLEYGRAVRVCLRPAGDTVPGSAVHSCHRAQGAHDAAGNGESSRANPGNQGQNSRRSARLRLFLLPSDVVSLRRGACTVRLLSGTRQTFAKPSRRPSLREGWCFRTHPPSLALELLAH